jgi:hypothetical protein
MIFGNKKKDLGDTKHFGRYYATENMEGTVDAADFRRAPDDS